MSLTKSTTARRRLSLLTGSSLVAAGLAAAASLGVTLTPTAAFAANECTTIGVDPTANDPGLVTRNADSYVCSANDYPNGITYTSHGALTVSTNTSTTTMTTNAGGIDLIGQLGDSVTFTATRPISGTAGPVINVTSVSGAITVSTTAAVTANTGTASHAIRAVSSGGGAVSVTTGAGAVNASATAVTTGEAAIEARSTGGNGAVIVTTGAGTVTGRLRGIYAQSSGTGALTINTNGSVVTNNTNPGIGQIAAIHAVAGTGPTNIGINGTVTGTAASAVLADTDGDIAVTVAASRTVSAALDPPPGSPAITAWVMNLAAGAGGSITLTNDGTIRSATNAVSATPQDTWGDRGLIAAGGSLLIENRNALHGRVDFSGVTAGVVFNNGGATGNGRGWRTTGESVFGPGADALNVADGYGIYVSGLTPALEDLGTQWDFAGGADAINLAAGAKLVVGPQGFSSFGGAGSGRLTITNLETFNNAGTIALGSQNPSAAAASVLSDDSPNDRLAMEGGAFTGSGASRIALDVNFQGTGQNTCEAAIVADCVYFPSVTTAGSTALTINDASTTTDFAGYLGQGIVLIDVTGGSSAASHFTLDPNSEHYIADGPNAGMMEKGYFLFALAFDPDNVQHKLISVPNTQLMTFTILPQAVQSVWHTSSGFAFDRQAQLRGADAGAGVWLRVGGESSERDLVQTFSLFDTSISYANTYTQQTNSLTGGVDLVGEAFGGVYSVGAMLGYVRSDVKFDDALTNATWEGSTLGLYGGYALGALRVDAVVNGLALAADLEDPVVDLPTGLINREVVRAVGARAEAGYRLDLGGMFVEPLLAASWVRGRFDQLVLQQAKIDYDEPTSARLGAGLRLGGDVRLDDITVRVDLTGRLWNEFEGENATIVDNDGEDLPLIDDFSGTFSEIGASASMVLDGGLGAFANAGGKFNDGYQAVNGALGLSYRW